MYFIFLAVSAGSLIWWFFSHFATALIVGAGVLALRIVNLFFFDEEIAKADIILGGAAFGLGSVVGLFIKPFHIYGMMGVILFNIVIAVLNIKSLFEPESEFSKQWSLW